MEKKPFKVGSLVSNGKQKMIVNSIFQLNGKWKMLIDDTLWNSKEDKGKYSIEVFCYEWYLIED